MTDAVVRVAYTGEPGAFAEEAVLRFFTAPEAVPRSSFRAVFEGVRDGAVDAGVVPVESSLLGTIRENVDLLWAFDLPVVGEVSVPVRLALLGLPGERLDTVETVFSITAALAQADEFLRSRPWTIQTTYNTAGAAKLVAERGERGERGLAAVAAARVAAIYGLEVLADDIQSGSDNRTRFAVIARRGEEARVLAAAAPGSVAGAPRTTLVFAVRNVAGSLHRSLGAFATRGLNLVRLESRPWTERGARWEYLFWVDLDGDPADPACAEALEALAAECELVRILGTYPRAAEE
ncbi:MAG TPA: prephenate dehydratase domain-containing protein [Candidatus Limnocylindrales bacterium]|nr:prephenate dehydratase domain-containing protein [Candidatus Limnocylindrales bacterium]